MSIKQTHEVSLNYHDKLKQFESFIFNVKRKNISIDKEALRLYIYNNDIEYKCIKCSNEGSWNDKPLDLILDFKNNNSNDYRLENIRFLCPNCCSQIHKKKHYLKKIIKNDMRFCVRCNKRIPKETIKSITNLKCEKKLCKACSHKLITTINYEDVPKYI